MAACLKQMNFSVTDFADHIPVYPFKETGFQSADEFVFFAAGHQNIRLQRFQRLVEEFPYGLVGRRIASVSLSTTCSQSSPCM